MSTGNTTGLKQIDLDQIWGELHRGIEHVYDIQKMSKPWYIQLYTHVHDYCTSVHKGNDRSSSSVLTKSKKNQVTGGAQLVGLELYKRLRDFLRNYVLSKLTVSNCCL